MIRTDLKQDKGNDEVGQFLPERVESKQCNNKNSAQQCFPLSKAMFCWLMETAFY